MRLIDADELKKSLDDRMINFEEICRDSVFNIIDDAPTVRLEYLPNYAGCESVEMIRVSRPQGEDVLKEGRINMNKKCSFCVNHCKDDTLYESSSWDGGIGFDYIRDIKFCPLCGKELQC